MPIAGGMPGRGRARTLRGEKPFGAESELLLHFRHSRDSGLLDRARHRCVVETSPLSNEPGVCQVQSSSRISLLRKRSTVAQAKERQPLPPAREENPVVPPPRRQSYLVFLKEMAQIVLRHSEFFVHGGDGLPKITFPSQLFRLPEPKHRIHIPADRVLLGWIVKAQRREPRGRKGSARPARSTLHPEPRGYARPGS